MHDFAEMVHRQRSYFLSQATKPYEFRMEKLRALSDWIDANESAVLDALARDLGKCAFEGYLTEVGMVRQELKDAMRHLARWMRPRRARTAVGQFPGRCRIYSEPYGVALIISPWNYPVQLCLSPLVGAISGSGPLRRETALWSSRRNTLRPPRRCFAGWRRSSLRRSM